MAQNELTSDTLDPRVVRWVLGGVALLLFLCALWPLPSAPKARAEVPPGASFSCSPCQFFWGELIQVELQPSIADADKVEFRLRGGHLDPNVPELPGDLVKLDINAPFDTAFSTYEVERWRSGDLYLLASAIRADGSRVSQGWVDVALVPVPSVPKFTMRPLVVAGSPVVKGVRVYNVPPEGVEVQVFAFGFHTRHKHRRLAVPVASEQRRGNVRTLLFERDLTIDREGAAWLQVLVRPQGAMKRFGVRIRARSSRAMLLRNKRGDTVVRQNPEESRCWIAFPGRPTPDCKHITGQG